MDTSKMKHFNQLDSGGLAQLLADSMQLQELAGTLATAMDEALTRHQIVELIEHHYDLGEVTDVYEIFGGYVNRSFGGLYRQGR